MTNCPSCRETLSHPSGDGCAAMAMHKELLMTDIAKEHFKDWFYEEMYGDRFPDKPVVDFDDTFSAFQQAMEDKIQAAYIAGYKKALSRGVS